MSAAARTIAAAAILDPDRFTFGDLLRRAEVQALATAGDGEKHFALLELVRHLLHAGVPGCAAALI